MLRVLSLLPDRSDREVLLAAIFWGTLTLLAEKLLSRTAEFFLFAVFAGKGSSHNGISDKGQPQQDAQQCNEPPAKTHDQKYNCTNQRENRDHEIRYQVHPSDLCLTKPLRVTLLEQQRAQLTLAETTQ